MGLVGYICVPGGCGASISPCRAFQENPTREENKIKNALNRFVLVCVCLIFSWLCLSLGGFSIVILLVSVLEITHCIIILVRAPE